MCTSEVDAASLLSFSIDEPLYEHYGRDMDALLEMAEGHVAFANELFSQQLFTADEGSADRYFRVGRIQV